VICEITCLDIKCSSTDSLKMLVFKFSNNMNKDKKLDGGVDIGDDMIFAGGGGLNFNANANNEGFDYCKQNTESTNGKRKDHAHVNHE